MLFTACPLYENNERQDRKMNENEMNNMEEDIIVFEDEDGNEYNYSVVDYMFYNEDGEESESFELVEDESLGQKLVEIFNTKMAEDGEEEE